VCIVPEQAIVATWVHNKIIQNPPERLLPAIELADWLLVGRRRSEVHGREFFLPAVREIYRGGLGLNLAEADAVVCIARNKLPE